MSKILVTGGSGFVGSHLTKKLCDEGHDVTVLDNLRTGDLNNLRSINQKHFLKFIYGDVTDPLVVNDAMRKVDYCFHLAALVSVEESIEHPDIAIDINIKGTLNVLNAARKAGVKRVVYSSSSSVYGLTSPYAVTKLTGEYLCGLYRELHSVSSTSLRYFNIYGEGQKIDSPYSAVIPRFIRRARKGQDIHIYGTGLQTRDFIHVSDIVKANMMAIDDRECLMTMHDVGTGEIISVNELAEMIIKLTNSSSKIVHMNERAGDIMYSRADAHSNLFHEMSEHKPIGIEEGLKKTIDFYRQ